MTHRFPIKEIALQAGIGTATVDRVLHERPNVSVQTRKRVLDAIKELEGQEAQLAARGRRLFVDVVVEAPARFSREIRSAVEAEIQFLRHAVLRPRFTFHELMQDGATDSALHRIANRGSQGVLLKARDEVGTRNAIATLTAKGIPVVTIFTDIPGSNRAGYAGLDNQAAGATAAYLIDRMLPVKAGSVIMTRSNDGFFGEEQRADGFCAALTARTDLSLVDASGGAGLYLSTASRIDDVLSEVQDIRAIYSMGGGNRAILDRLALANVVPEIFVAHDLDRENVRLLEERKIDFVLHDDLRQDVRAAFQYILRHHKLAPMIEQAQSSDVLIVTPANLRQWLG